MRFCGCTERFSDPNVPQYRLATNKPTFFIQNKLPAKSADWLLQVFLAAANRWSRVCDIQFSHATSAADASLLIVCTRLDGPSGVLADCELPMPGLVQQRMRIDDSDKWDAFDGPTGNGTDLTRVLCHELGHFMGLQHYDPSPPPQLLEPMYSQTVNKPQNDESEFVARWFGKPRAATPSPKKCTLTISGPLDAGTYDITPRT